MLKSEPSIEECRDIKGSEKQACVKLSVKEKAAPAPEVK